jgi:hypothetical protein
MAKTIKTVKTVKTNNSEDVIRKSNNLGDQLNEMFQLNKDLKVAALALVGYKTAISSAKELIKYKKLTGSPETIEFFENK